MGEFVERWIARQKGLEASTRVKYERELGYVLEHLGKTKLRDIRPHHIKDVLARLADKEAASGLGKGRTLAGIRTRVRAVMREAVTDSLISSDPTMGVKRVKPLRTEHPGIALDFPQAARFHELGDVMYQAGLCRLWPALFTCISIGLRRGEVMAINFKTGVLSVRRSLGVVHGKATARPSAKTDAGNRDVPISANLQAVLKKHREVMLDEAKVRGDQVRPESPVFACIEGKATHPDNLNRALEIVLEWSDPDCKPLVSKQAKKRKKRKAARPMTLEGRLRGVHRDYREALVQVIRAGDALPRISPHDLRHTAGTLMLRTDPNTGRQGMPVEVISRLLGHSDIAMTYRVYRHVLESEKRQFVPDLFPVLPQRQVNAVSLN